MTDPGLAHVIKIIETPKGEDGVSADRKMLSRLRRYARAYGRALTGFPCPAILASMRGTLAALTIALAASPPGLQAQIDYNARLGLTWATPLIRDNIVEEIEVQQKLAPTLAFGASLPIAPKYQTGIEVALTSSGYEASENGTSTSLGTLRTGSITLGLHGPLVERFYWRFGAGLLGYWPNEEQGIFLSGGTTRFLAGAGLDYRLPVSSHWEMMASLRYDYHRFITDELQARGFSQSQGVQRISATVGIARGKK